MNRLIGIGACVMDTLITLPVYPQEDTKLRALEVKTCGGGPAATGLVAAARLGISAGYIGVLAGDEGGRFLLEDFARYGVDTTGTERLGRCRSFTSSIWLSARQRSRTCVFDKGDLPPLTLSEEQKRMAAQAELLLVDGNELDAAVEAAGIIRQAGGRVLYDAGGLYEGVERLLECTDILIPSEEFALGHTGKATAEQAAQALYAAYHPRVVVITQGKKGGLFYDGERLLAYPAYPADVVDSNGAGDVFHGAFAAGLLHGYTEEACCHYASAASALKCGGTGARESAPRHDDVLDLLRRNGYEL